MTDDSSSDGKVDVRAKLAQMSGTRLRKQRAELAADKKTTKGKKKRRREAEDPKEAERIAKKAKQIEEMLAAEPRDPADGEDAAPAPTPAPKPQPKPKKKREEFRTPAPDDDRAELGAPVAFVIGLLGGCLPAIVTLAMGALGSTAPDGLPAEAVERSRDWIHCSKAVSANRWACDVFDYSGTSIGKGEFVPAVGAKGNDWRVFAGKDQLAIDGEYDNRLANSTMVYVEGVAVSSERNRGKK